MGEDGVSLAETAIVSEKASIGKGVQVGHYSIIEGSVRIGDNTRIGPHCYIRDGTEIGSNCVVEAGAQVGIFPKGFPIDSGTGVIIGDRVQVGEKSLVERSSKNGERTRIGDGSFVLPDVHVAHSCNIGKNVFLTNGVKLAGYARLEDYVNLAGNVGVHQFVSIGRCAFVGGGTMVRKDIVPYAWLSTDNVRKDERLQVYGLNGVGIGRMNSDTPSIDNLKAAYAAMRNDLNLDSIMQKLAGLNTPEANEILLFLRRSSRGCYLVRSNRVIDPTRLYRNKGEYHSRRGLR